MDDENQNWVLKYEFSTKYDTGERDVYLTTRFKVRESGDVEVKWLADGVTVGDTESYSVDDDTLESWLSELKELREPPIEDEYERGDSITVEYAPIGKEEQGETELDPGILTLENHTVKSADQIDIPRTEETPDYIGGLDGKAPVTTHTVQWKDERWQNRRSIDNIGDEPPKITFEDVGLPKIDRLIGFGELERDQTIEGLPEHYTEDLPGNAFRTLRYISQGVELENLPEVLNIDEESDSVFDDENLEGGILTDNENSGESHEEDKGGEEQVPSLLESLEEEFVEDLWIVPPDKKENLERIVEGRNYSEGDQE